MCLFCCLTENKYVAKETFTENRMNDFKFHTRFIRGKCAFTIEIYLEYQVAWTILSDMNLIRSRYEKARFGFFFYIF